MNGVNQIKRTWQMEPADTRPELSAKMLNIFDLREQALSKKHSVTLADAGAILGSARLKRPVKPADARRLPVTQTSERT
jgi:hypothetical protein